MIAIAYPPYQPRLRQETGQQQIFDEVRLQWVVLTPEEWVRQHFLQYLLQVLHYPAKLMAVEKEITVGELKKRCDIVVYNLRGAPLLLVECKETSVPLNDKVLEQALRYNSRLQVKYIVITNGHHTAAFVQENKEMQPVTELPDWQNIAD